jgi:PncC family amidohydrolase
MARAARERLAATWGIAITGIAGPAGGTDAKPVGLVFTALAGPDGARAERHVYPGDRGRVRLRSALSALNMLRLALRGLTPGGSSLR